MCIYNLKNVTDVSPINIAELHRGHKKQTVPYKHSMTEKIEINLYTQFAFFVLHLCTRLLTHHGNGLH